MKFITRQLYKFSNNAIKDSIYEFDRSAISFSVRLKSLKDFNDFDKLRQLNIHRIIYNLNNEAEVMDFLAQHNDECIKKMFDPSFFIQESILTFRQYLEMENLENWSRRPYCKYVSTYLNQRLIRIRHNFKCLWYDIVILYALKHDGVIGDEAEFLGLVKEELDDLQSVIENSFNFEVNHVLNHNEKFTYDQVFKLANQQKTLKSVNFNIYKYANPLSSELDQNREILATLYQHVNEQYNTIFLKNYLFEDKYIKQTSLSDGIVSYSHLVDMLKLMHYKGSLVFDYNKNLEKNVGFIDQLLQSNKYILCDKSKLGEEHESHIIEGDTMPPIDV